VLKIVALNLAVRCYKWKWSYDYHYFDSKMQCILLLIVCFCCLMFICVHISTEWN